MRRYANHRLVKKLRTYTVEEIGRLLGTHRNTVRRWIKVGLQTIDQKRPTLVLGADLILFLQIQRGRHKQRCLPEQIYCVRCRAPKSPAGGMVDYSPINGRIGTLTAICPDCNSIMNRFIGTPEPGAVSWNVDIPDTAVVPRLRETAQPHVNSDFR